MKLMIKCKKNFKLKLKTKKRMKVYTKSASFVNVLKFMIHKSKFSSIIVISVKNAYMEWIITVTLQATALENIVPNILSCS